ncbi:hypothetical protein LMC10_10360 [Limosilactobacillus reuteri]|uniref:hypothetical protein n=1 Tax=Limosilactobacillus reuteri TaxID=1598 RepID=UPI001E40465F|nr:hypothetical protein [Limosilactobacillus reuteri]MCC4400473.1 hypothetical protein [Limosilactobacillus reuteri]MCC4402866.1 hypothetical protein [Limosilactobacillus reuteri]
MIYFDSPIRRLWIAYYKYSQPLNWDYQGAGFNIPPWDVFTVHQFTGSDMDRNMVNTTKEGWLKMANPNDVAVNLRYSARTKSNIIATLPAGSTIKYDAFSRHAGYVWIRQPRENGYGYMAVRDTKTNQPFGKFE